MGFETLDKTFKYKISHFTPGPWKSVVNPTCTKQLLSAAVAQFVPYHRSPGRILILTSAQLCAKRPPLPTCICVWSCGCQAPCTSAALVDQRWGRRARVLPNQWHVSCTLPWELSDRGFQENSRALKISKEKTQGKIPKGFLYYSCNITFPKTHQNKKWKEKNQYGKTI